MELRVFYKRVFFLYDYFGNVNVKLININSKYDCMLR